MYELAKLALLVVPIVLLVLTGVKLHNIINED